MRSSRTALIVVAIVLSACAPSPASPVAPPADRDWRIFVIDYGRSEIDRAVLVRGARPGEQAAMAWDAWLLVSRASAGRRILVDTGFDDAALAETWRFARRERVAAILGRAGLAPTAITDVVLTHAHWDHAGDTSPYTGARFWIQQAALDWAGSRAATGDARFRHVAALRALRSGGRLTPLSGAREIAPGVALEPGGGHAPGMQWVRVALGDPRRRTIAIASDVAYLRENVERLVPTGSTSNPEADLAALRAMLAATGNAARVLPGHDPAATAGLARVVDGLYELE